jgi:hypothetical protein
MEPTEFLSKLQSELQERRVMPDAYGCKTFSCMTLTNPNNGITTTRISTSSVHAEFEGDGDGDGGDGGDVDYMMAGNSNMMMMALALMVVLMVVAIVVMVIRYRKQKRQKDAFFEKLDQDDNDNALDDEYDDE